MKNMKIVKVGAKVRDINTGRVGVVTEVDEDGFFARPAELPYVTTADIPGVGNQMLITATYWNEREDGKYTGIWADAKLNEWTAVELVDAE